MIDEIFEEKNEFKACFLKNSGVFSKTPEFSELNLTPVSPVATVPPLQSLLRNIVLK
jgi:hypothetical protein